MYCGCWKTFAAGAPAEADDLTGGGGIGMMRTLPIARPQRNPCGGRAHVMSGECTFTPRERNSRLSAAPRAGYFAPGTRLSSLRPCPVFAALNALRAVSILL